MKSHSEIQYSDKDNDLLSLAVEPLLLNRLRTMAGAPLLGPSFCVGLDLAKVERRVLASVGDGAALVGFSTFHLQVPTPVRADELFAAEIKPSREPKHWEHLNKKSHGKGW